MLPASLETGPGVPRSGDYLMKTMFTLLALGAAVAAATPAMAAKTFDFTFGATLDNGDAVSGSGTLTTDDGVVDASGATIYAVTGVTGFGKMDWMSGQSAIIGLLDNQSGSVFGRNGSYSLGSLPLEFDGIPYFFDMRSTGSSITGRTMDAVGSEDVAVTLSLQTSAVPEAATWAQMIAGFGVLGGVMRRRRVTARFTVA